MRDILILIQLIVICILLFNGNLIGTVLVYLFSYIIYLSIQINNLKKDIKKLKSRIHLNQDKITKK